MCKKVGRECGTSTALHHLETAQEFVEGGFTRLGLPTGLRMRRKRQTEKALSGQRPASSNTVQRTRRTAKYERLTAKPCTTRGSCFYGIHSGHQDQEGGGRGGGGEETQMWKREKRQKKWGEHHEAASIRHPLLAGGWCGEHLRLTDSPQPPLKLHSREKQLVSSV